MSRRGGQNPSVRIGKRADGTKYFFFQYWVDVPGQEERERRTEVVGLVGTMTKMEAERKKLDFIMNLKVNSSDYKLPSSKTFADAVRYYREVFAPRMLRGSTFSVADGHIKKHLEADWNDAPIEHITIDSVNEWIWKKRNQGLSWVTIKNILRTMQRVLSCSSKDKKPPFSQEGLAIPERDTLRMKIENRRKDSLSWDDTKRIAEKVETLDGLDDSRRKQYATVFLLAAASGLRCGELFALRWNDVDFKASTIRVDESAEQRLYHIGPCKNAAAYRTVLLHDAEGKEMFKKLRAYLKAQISSQNPPRPVDLIFRSRRGSPLRETNVLRDGLHPVLRSLELPQSGMHAFRHGCNRRWELAGLKPAVIRQQMGHSSAVMTALYTGEIPFAEVRNAFANAIPTGHLENMENGRSSRHAA